MALLISSPKDLEKLVDRSQAPELFKYVELGGILRVEGKKGSIRVLYPTKKMVREKIKELEERRREILHEIRKIRKLERKSPFLDVLKLKHRILLALDREYRELAEILDLESLFKDGRGRKIVEQLQKDKEYRQRVREALEKSPVYKRSKFGAFVEKTEEVKGNLLSERIQRLESLLEKVDRELDALRGILRYL